MNNSIGLSNMKEQIAYLQGLSSGMGLHHKSKEGKLIVHTIDLLEQIVDTLEYIVEEQEELNEHLDILDEDLEAIEQHYDEEVHYAGTDYQCPYCGERIDYETVIHDVDDAGAREMFCPSCHNEITNNQIVSYEKNDEESLLEF